MNADGCVSFGCENEVKVARRSSLNRKVEGSHLAAVFAGTPIPERKITNSCIVADPLSLVLIITEGGGQKNVRTR